MVNDELKTLPKTFSYWKRRLKNYPKNTGEYQSEENALINKGNYYKVGNKEIVAMYILHPSAPNFDYQTGV